MKSKSGYETEGKALQIVNMWANIIIFPYLKLLKNTSSWRNLKCMTSNESSQILKCYLLHDSICMSLRKGKTTGLEIRSGVARAWGGRRG